MRVIGIDPGLRSSGFGIIDVTGNRYRCLAWGEIKNPPKRLPSRCLVNIGDAIRDLLHQHRPEVMAIEGLVYVQNTRIAFTLGQVRGAMIAATAAQGLDIYEYAPRRVKQAVTGRGSAGKQQVAGMVRGMLGLVETPPPDAADALAIAICHAESQRGLAIKPAKPI